MTVGFYIGIVCLLVIVLIRAEVLDDKLDEIIKLLSNGGEL